MRWLIAFLVVLAFATANAADYMDTTDGRLLTAWSARQCVVVTTASWPATTGTMSLLERESVMSPWRSHRSNIPVVVGRAGMAWGRGIAGETGPQMKQEGDNKAPAGVFILHGVFGYAPRAKTAMPYQTLSSNIVGVDDPHSRYYNQLIDQSKVANRDWGSAEKMKREDNLYRWGVIVDHNVPPQPGAGSCIFLHIWRGPNRPTVGCTAMSEKNIVDLIRWLDPKRAPLLIQLPRPIYENYRTKWNLP